MNDNDLEQKLNILHNQIRNAHIDPHKFTDSQMITWVLQTMLIEEIRKLNDKLSVVDINL